MLNVSIITVCFNSEKTIQGTIDSVLAQDYPAIEYIIVDGASSDGTLNLVSSYGDKISKVISEPDRGIYDAMNKGILSASGDVICMLNSDDLYANPSSIRHLVEHIQASGADSVFADLLIVDRENTGRIIRHYDSSRFAPEKLRFGWMPAHPTFLAKRSVFKNWGLYSLDYRIASDFEMMARLFFKGRVSYAYLPEVVIRMRAGGISTAGLRNSWILNKEIVSACRENGIKTCLPLLLAKIPRKLLELFKARRIAKAELRQ